jgi:hypothetical protein
MLFVSIIPVARGPQKGTTLFDSIMVGYGKSSCGSPEFSLYGFVVCNGIQPEHMGSSLFLFPKTIVNARLMCLMVCSALPGTLCTFDFSLVIRVCSVQDGSMLNGLCNR